MTKKTHSFYAAATTAAVTLALSGAAQAGETNPFSATSLQGGYQLAENAEGRCGEGRCGGDAAPRERSSKDRSGEGRCGGNAASGDKASEGRCGEGRSGSGATSGEKASEGQCGEARCGGNR